MRMLSPTLFWYIFKDLLRVFFLCNGALAGILSFGGLLRPLTEQGLEAWQVGLLLSYFTPAMTAYSLPIAALFATTVIYGRLSADNEVLACRAGGLSHLSLALPAAILGLLVAVISALLLLFIVPIYTLKIEHVIYANLARIIANDIERKHQIRLPGMNLTVFARSAYLPPGQTRDTLDQQVVLVNPTIVTFESPFANDPDKLKARLQVAKDFHTASEATIHLTQKSDDQQVQLSVVLNNGSKFPASLASAQLGGVETAQAGPFEMPSPIKEDTKFMNILQLRKLFENPQSSARIKGILAGFVHYEQEFMFLHAVRDQLNDPPVYSITFDSYGKQRITFEHLDGAHTPPVFEKGGEVIINSTRNPNEVVRKVRMTVQRTDQKPTVYEARDVTIKARPVTEAQRVDVNIELKDVVVHNDVDGTLTPRKALPFSFAVPMEESAKAVEHKTFLNDKINPNRPRSELIKANLTQEQKKLLRELTVLGNNIVIQSNMRISFAISCLVLTFVGGALGMMFRSGNFLTAFAVSFIPALISITLIVAGQRVGGTIPIGYPKGENPLQLGLGLVWLGNAANLVFAIVLWWRLQRQ